MNTGMAHLLLPIFVRFPVLFSCKCARKTTQKASSAGNITCKVVAATPERSLQCANGTAAIIAQSGWLGI